MDTCWQPPHRPAPFRVVLGDGDYFRVRIGRIGPGVVLSHGAASDYSHAILYFAHALCSYASTCNTTMVWSSPGCFNGVLAQHRVDSPGAVDHLGDAQVDGQARQREGVLAIEFVVLNQ